MKLYKLFPTKPKEAKYIKYHMIKNVRMCTVKTKVYMHISKDSLIVYPFYIVDQNEIGRVKALLILTIINQSPS